jgi:trehalose-phosphatase
MTRRLFDVLDEVGDRIREAPRHLLCLDFDGTLTPLVADPSLAVLRPSVVRVLRTLACCDSLTMAIISGRDRNDLFRRVRIPRLIYAGNHGLDIRGPGYTFVEPTAASQTKELRELALALTTNLQRIAGVIVEFKGLTISVHYRQVADDARDEVRRVVHATLAVASRPFVLRAGNAVHEIRPQVDWNKGTAVVWIRGQMGEPDALPIYVGDDTTDEDAFMAIRGDGISVKVGAEIDTAARYRVADPSEARHFLKWLDRTLTPAASRPA